MSNRSQKKKTRKGTKKHPQSQSVNELYRKVTELEDQLRRRDIAISYPHQNQSSQEQLPPMLGHTKGNTKSNRKVVKKLQQKELQIMYSYLLTLVPSAEKNDEGSSRKRKRKRKEEVIEFGDEQFSSCEDENFGDDSLYHDLGLSMIDDDEFDDGYF